MIRLGSRAGYRFGGARLLAGGTPPAAPAVYAILCQPDPDSGPNRYAVIYVGHSDDLSAERLPFRHPDAHLWVRRARSRGKGYAAAYEGPRGRRPHPGPIPPDLTPILPPNPHTPEDHPSWRDAGV